LWKRARQAWSIIGITFVVVFVGFTAYDWLVNAPKAKSVELGLKKEFDSIGQLPGAERRDLHVSHKTQQALVGGTYSTTGNCAGTPREQTQTEAKQPRLSA